MVVTERGLNLSDDEAHVFYNIFCCKRTDFSFKYLGDPLHHTKLRKEDDHQKMVAGTSLCLCSLLLLLLFNQQIKESSSSSHSAAAAAAVPLFFSFCEMLRYPLPAATVQPTKETSSSSSAVAARVAARLLPSSNEHSHFPTESQRARLLAQTRKISYVYRSTAQTFKDAKENRYCMRHKKRKRIFSLHFTAETSSR